MLLVNIIIQAFTLAVTDALPSRVSPDKVFIAVKTTAKFHKSRLEPVLNTWYHTAPDATYFFTDAAADRQTERLAASVSGRNPLIVTDCPSDHSRTSLSCKLEAEISQFLTPQHDNKDWFCHLDDDNYLNTPALLDMLARYPANQPWYLGKVSIPKQLEVLDRLQLPEKKTVKFWFATGGAGFCISRGLAEKMRPFVVDGQFQELSNTIRLPDDVTMGYLMEILLEIPLTQVSLFHSHLEPLRTIKDIKKQITFSYSKYEDTSEDNVVEFEDDVSDNNLIDNDPTRFYKIHCKLFNECF